MPDDSALTRGFAPLNPASNCDVLVIGGGPAGSTAAAMLAERGWRVVLLEKERHPRFHIGESLLPLNLPLFERLGVRAEVEAIAMIKYGAELCSPHHDWKQMFLFAEALDKSFPYAYQVPRAAFDHILLRNCERKGAAVIERCRVTDVQFPDAGGCVVSADGDDGTRHWRSRYVVDATGRDAFLAGKLGIKRRNPRHASAALFGHFEGVERLPGRDEGNISIFWFEHGWFWLIPLVNGVTSIGAVCAPRYLQSRKVPPQQFLHDTIALCPLLAARMQAARLISPVTATGNYSYQAERMAGDRYVMVGDAFAFIDPVFSSGVFFAMNSAMHAAETVDGSLRAPARRKRLERRFDATVRRGLSSFSWFIYRMTSPSMRELLMAPRNVFRVQEAVLSLLAGDVFRSRAVHARLVVFKAIYSLKSLRSMRGSLAAWRSRRRNAGEAAREALGS
jgi:flavin-dependent dehydrogenase